MNASLKMRIMLVVSGGLLVLALTSCTNPSGARFIEEPSTGIDADAATGLVAGIPLEGEEILTNPDVFVSGTVTWEEGLSGSAMRGDEDGDFFRIADGTLPELTTSGTIEVWIYPEHTVEDDNFSAGILHKGDETDFSDEAWSLQNWYSEQIAFNYQPASGAAYKQTKTVTNRISVEVWHHIAVTWNCDEISGDVELNMYIDGLWDNGNTFAALGPMVDSDGDILVGSQLPEKYDDTYGHMSFMGLIDEVSIYDHVRTAEEILADYKVFFPAS